MLSETVEITAPNSTMENQATVSAVSSSQQDTLQDLTSYQDTSVLLLSNISLLKTFAELSAATGGYVQLLPEMSYMPVLIGSDNQPIFLYRIVEAIDEYLDVDRILEDFPNLNYSQVVGSINFLRKVAQMNSQKIDIDDLEDEFEANDLDFLTLLEASFNNKEVVRVLAQPE